MASVVGSATVVVLTGGDPSHLPAPPLDDAAMVIAADSGLALAAELGLHVDLVTGDMDSVDPGALDTARRAGTQVDLHPVDKDRTDLAIALDAAREHTAGRVTVVGGHGGRLDHHLANLLLLAAPEYGRMEITAYMGPAVVTVVRDRRELAGSPGELVSLLAVHGPARGVTTDGLRFPLHDDALLAGSSRGVSNEFTSAQATVQLTSGVLVAVQPGPSPHPSPRKARRDILPFAPHRGRRDARHDARARCVCGPHRRGTDTPR